LILCAYQSKWLIGKNSQIIREDVIPESHKALASKMRQQLIEVVADHDELIADKYVMEEEITELDLLGGIRRATLGLKFTPVFMGSAYKNTAVQPLLDGVRAFLPSPAEVPINALDISKNEAPVELTPDPQAPLVALAFKLEEGRFGQLTYLRIYQGTLKKGNQVTNVRTGKKIKVARVVRLHSNELEV